MWGTTPRPPEEVTGNDAGLTNPLSGACAASGDGKDLLFRMLQNADQQQACPGGTYGKADEVAHETTPLSKTHNESANTSTCREPAKDDQVERPEV